MPVIPAHAGIQENHPAAGRDSRVRGSDGHVGFFPVYPVGLLFKIGFKFFFDV